MPPEQSRQLEQGYDSYYPASNQFPPPPGANYSPQAPGYGQEQYAHAPPPGPGQADYGYSPMPPSGGPPGGFHQPNYGPPPSGAAGAYTPPEGGMGE